MTIIVMVNPWLALLAPLTSQVVIDVILKCNWNLSEFQCTTANNLSLDERNTSSGSDVSSNQAGASGENCSSTNAFGENISATANAHLLADTSNQRQVLGQLVQTILS